MDAELLDTGCLSLLKKAGSVVVGLSGGRDSVALLHLLHGAGLQVVVCHVHHGIRGADADADAAFCRMMADALGVDFVEKRADVPRYAGGRGLSLETAAREARYEAFRECAAACGTPYVALGHHRQDQAETVLFRLCRGSGGHLGMKPIACREDGLVLVRPLLDIPREQLTAYLEGKGIPWREDASNGEADVVRNRLRLQVLPLLEDIMGRDVVPVINRSARIAEEASAALAAAVAALEVEDPQGRLYLPKVAAYPVELQKVIVHRYLKRQGVRNVSEEVVLAVVSIIRPGSPARLSLPGGRFARRREKRLFLE